MTETILLGRLLPANPVILDILSQIREKYGISKFDASDPVYAEQLLNDPGIPWDEIKKEIQEQFINYPDVIPQGFKSLIQYITENPDKEPTAENLFNSLEYTEEAGRQAAMLIFRMMTPFFGKAADFIDFNVDFMMAYLMTGETQPIPFEWFSGVMTIPTLDGEPLVVVMASRLSDPKQLQKEFMTEYNRVFGKDRPQIKDGDLNAAEYTRMKLEGTPISDIADAYMLNRPSEFPKDPKSKEYRAAKRRLEERLKKQLQRRIKKFMQLLGDKND